MRPCGDFRALSRLRTKSSVRRCPNESQRACSEDCTVSFILASVGTICGGVCGCRQNWEVPGPATRVLLATSIGHVLPAIARTARALGLTVYGSPSMLDV